MIKRALAAHVAVRKQHAEVSPLSLDGGDQAIRRRWRAFSLSLFRRGCTVWVSSSWIRMQLADDLIAPEPRCLVVDETSRPLLDSAPVFPREGGQRCSYSGSLDSLHQRLEVAPGAYWQLGNAGM
jgi:hypothetical protein